MTGALLTLEDIGTEQEGNTYFAFVWNEAGWVKSDEVKINVRVPVLIESQPESIVTVDEGKSTAIKIDAKNYKRILWVERSSQGIKVMGKGAELELRRVTAEQHDNTYWALITNRDGTKKSYKVRLEVNLKPRALISIKELSKKEVVVEEVPVKLGEWASLTFLVEGKDISTQWYELYQDGRSEAIGAQVFSTYMTDEVTAKDEGRRFYAVAKNGAGEVKSRIFIIRVLMPVEIAKQPEPVVEAYEGKKVRVGHIDAKNYTTITWIEGTVKGFNVVGTGADLELEVTAAHHNREYWALVTGPNGAVESHRTRLIVHLKPKAKVEPKREIEVRTIEVGNSTRIIFDTIGNNRIRYGW